MKTRIFLFNWIFVLLSCAQLESGLEKVLSTKAVREILPLDQGTIFFDETGNITVDFNNIDFKFNPLISEISYIGVWVFPKGGNPMIPCCSGSSTLCGSATLNCLRGVGFSNDLGFLGNRYIFQAPPRSFNRNSDRYTISVKAANSDGVPADYQGEYTPFSGPTGPVNDRTMFDLYLGFYYTIVDPESSLPRPINSKAEIGKLTYYNRIAPDLISPKIEIEAQFFPQSIYDPSGTTYSIPRITTWATPPTLDRELDKRGNILINEIGNEISSTSANDFIELYNPTDFKISLDDVFLFRYTSRQCKTLGEPSQKEELTGGIIGPKGFYTLARVGNNLQGIDKTFKTSSGITLSEGDCIALVKGTSNLPNLSTARLIDFVGTTDSSKQNQYLGEGLAPPLFSDSSISRCPDGGNSRNNKDDFTIEISSPGSLNQCNFLTPSTSISDALDGEILISEVSHSQNESFSGDGSVSTILCDNSTGESDFVEVRNYSQKTFNIGGSRIQYISSTGTVSSYYTFPSVLLAPGESIAVISQDKGCYTRSILSGRKVLFRSESFITSPFNLSGSSASIALTKNSRALSSQLNQNGTILDPDSITLDYVGWNTSAKVFQTGKAPNCNISSTNRRSLRRISTTKNNATDFQCGTINGSPGNDN